VDPLAVVDAVEEGAQLAAGVGEVLVITPGHLLLFDRPHQPFGEAVFLGASEVGPAPARFCMAASSLAASARSRGSWYKRLRGQPVTRATSHRGNSSIRAVPIARRWPGGTAARPRLFCDGEFERELSDEPFEIGYASERRAIDGGPAAE